MSFPIEILADFSSFKIEPEFDKYLYNIFDSYLLVE